MEWTSLDTWIVVTGVLSAVSCALLGNFLLLKRMSMMGDAISHAVLPGLAIAFLVTGSRGSVAMLIGAAVVGVLTALFTEWIHRFGKVEQSAAMGVVFTALFAVGLILIVRAADAVDLDPGCVLYGAIELVPLDVTPLLGFEVPLATLIVGGAFAVNLVFTLLFYKELRISAFDPALATTLGISARLMHYLLMTLVAVTTVASFESVGSILVIAMLIVPPAAAHLLTDRLHTMLLISLLVAAASAGLGHVGAITVPTWFGYADTSTAGMMAVSAGLLFTLALLAGPRHGVLSKLVHRTALSLRISREDALGLLFRAEESRVTLAAGAVPDLLRRASGSGRLLSWLTMATLRRSGRVVRDELAYRLTAAGRREAGQLVRAHRLWESYLLKHVSLPADHLHPAAERMEHFITSPLQQGIARDLKGVETDPHGRPIPESGQDEAN
jgi:manganese/zinc/iron transport system permease protein